VLKCMRARWGARGVGLHSQAARRAPRPRQRGRRRRPAQGRAAHPRVWAPVPGSVPGRGEPGPAAAARAPRACRWARNTRAGGLRASVSERRLRLKASKRVPAGARQESTPPAGAAAQGGCLKAAPGHGPVTARRAQQMQFRGTPNRRHCGAANHFRGARASARRRRFGGGGRQSKPAASRPAARPHGAARRGAAGRGARRGAAQRGAALQRARHTQCAVANRNWLKLSLMEPVRSRSNAFLGGRAVGGEPSGQRRGTAAARPSAAAGARARRRRAARGARRATHEGGRAAAQEQREREELGQAQRAAARGVEALEHRLQRGAVELVALGAGVGWGVGG
jgi:hypothetical protein